MSVGKFYFREKNHSLAFFIFILVFSIMTDQDLGNFH